MNTNAVLEEVWAAKNRLAAEAGGDIHVFCRQLREWERLHMPAGFKMRTVIRQEEARKDETALVLREEDGVSERNKQESNG